MTKRILSVLIVLCMALTFVPFFGSAATISGGYLMIDSSQAASGEGWSWENGVLTLGNSEEFSGVLLSVDAKVVLTEDVMLRGALIFGGEGVLETGDYNLTLSSGINASQTLTVVNSNVLTNSVSATNLVISNSRFDADCSASTNVFGIYSQELVIEQSVVYATTSMDTDVELGAIMANDMTITDSIVKLYGNAYGIIVNESDAGLEINNSTIYADAGVAGIATSRTYGTEITSFDTLVVNDAEVTTPEYASLSNATRTDYTGTTTAFLTIVDVYGAVAKSVVIEADDASVLPNGGQMPEFPDAPELPELPDAPDTPDEPELKETIYYDTLDGEMYITVVTQGDYDRIALFNAKDTSIDSAVAVASEYSELVDGFREWLLVAPAPTSSTEFIIKCRDAATKSYKNGKEFPVFTIAPVESGPELKELYVGGVNAFENPEGDGWYFDESTDTLVLENCTLTQSATFVNDWEEVVNAVIYAKGDLNIEFYGDNFIENHVEEIPETNTTYGGIFLDGTHNEYLGDVLTITGEGNLTVGLAIERDVYETGLVEFSFGVYAYNEDINVDLSILGAETKVDVYGGVVGTPETYNVRPYIVAPYFLNGNKVTAYKDIEGTILDENGYDLNDNEAWRVVIETTSASIDEYGVLNIMNDGDAYGTGWSWENGVLTLGDIDFKAISIMAENLDAKIVLTQDVVLDTRADLESVEAISTDSISFVVMDSTSTFEIDTGDYTLTILNNCGYGINSYGNLVINGTVAIDTFGTGSGIYASGTLVIDNSKLISEGGDISVYDIYDYESEQYINGDLIITNSEVYVNCLLEADETGYVPYMNALYAYNSITIENSVVEAYSTAAAISATNDVYIRCSDISVYGVYTAIEALVSLTIDNSTVLANSDYLAIAAGDEWDYENLDTALTLRGVNILTPEMGTTAVVAVEVDGWEYETNTVVDADGNAATSIYLEPSNTASYEIINGKLIITVVTEGRMNRIALCDAAGKSLKTFNTYEVDENGNYVWTIKIDAPTVETDYIIKARDAETNSYKNGATLPTLTIEPEVVIESVEVETRGDKVYVIATTVSDNYDRIAIVNPVDSSYVKYTRNYEYDYENDRYVWTIFFDYALVDGMDNLLVKARDIRNNRYNNAQAVEITVDAPVEPVTDITITDYDENRILVTVTTIPDLYRVKIAFADDAASHIAYAKTPATKTDDAWTWEMIIDRPAETTEYAVDVAYAKAYARYYTYVTYTK